MKQIISQMSFNVHEKSIIYSNQNILVAISGGQDSILLLFILVHLKKTLNLKLEIIFCNHFWQPINFYSVHQIFSLSYLFKIPFYIGLGFGDINSEQTARIWRRKIFFRVAHFSTLSMITIGHTTNDQIETALWHLFRGTSPTGIISLKQKNYLNNNGINSENTFFLQKIQTKNKIENFIIRKFYKTKIWGRKTNKARFVIQRKNRKKIYLKNFLSRPQTKTFLSYWFFNMNLLQLEINRPLIDFNREDITQIVNINKIPLLLDPTNQSLHFSRNKIRLICFPLLEHYLNQNSKFNIKKYLILVEDEQKFLRKRISTFIQKYSTNPLEIKFLFKSQSCIQIKISKYLIEKYTNKQPTYIQSFIILQNGSPGTRTRN